MPEGMDDRPRPPVLPGVAGMFGQVYWHLGHASLLHPQMTEAQVDACLVSTAAMYLGVRPRDGDDPEFGPLTGDFAADAARVNQRRLEAAERAARQAQAEQAAEDTQGP